LEILRLENIIYVEVKRKKLEVFKISHVASKIYVFVYNLVLFDLRLQRQVIKYYQKVVNIKSVVQRFGLCERYIIHFLRTVNIAHVIIKNTMFIVSKYSVIILCSTKNSVLLFYIILRKWYLGINFIKFYISIRVLLCHNINNLFYGTRRHLKKKKKLNRALKKISGLVFFNLFSVFMENIFFCLLGYFLKVNISNVLLLGGFRAETRYYNKFIKQDFRFSFYTVLLSLLYCNSKLLANYLVAVIKKQKNHFKILKFFTDLVTFYFVRNLYYVAGIQIRVTGKLGGKMRRSKFHYKIGKVQLHTFKTVLSYNMSFSYTKFGIISVKIWLICN
jgi:hypothetical protein